MDKHLYLIRHAKAENSVATTDRQRPLSRRGQSDAARMAERLPILSRLPQRILCSPAQRTRQTAELLWPQPDDIEFCEEIYENDLELLLSIVGALSHEVERAALVGHNPSISLLAGWLDGSANRSDRLDFSAGDVALFQLNGWDELSAGCGRLLDYLSVKS